MMRRIDERRGDVGDLRVFAIARNDHGDLMRARKGDEARVFLKLSWRTSTAWRMAMTVDGRGKQLQERGEVFGIEPL